MDNKERLNKIKKQVEFYFGDANLPKDRFLREQIASDKDGFVKIEILCKFKRIQVLEGTIEDIVSLFENDSFLKISDDKSGIRRITDLPLIDDSASRTLCIRNLPLDSTQEGLEVFFENLEPNGINAVRMIRRRKRGEETTRPFVGVVYVEFKTVENFNSVLSKKDEVKMNDIQLEIKTYDDNQRDRKERFEKRKKDRKRKNSGEVFDEKLKEVKELYEGCLVKIKEIPVEPKVTFRDLKAKIISEMNVSNVYVDFPYKEDSTVAVLRFENKEAKEGFMNSEKCLFGEKKQVLEDVTKEESDQFFKTMVKEILRSDHEPPNKKRRLD